MSTYPTVYYQVVRPEESAAKGHGHLPIPTLGHPASYCDAYRTVAIGPVENKPASWCLTDTDAAAALGRIIDGPIRSYEDIERAESALRAILLYDFVEVLVPCAKGEQPNGFVHYVRFDEKERNDAAFAAFQTANCRDLLFATEYITFGNGVVESSSNQNSKLLGQPTEQLSDNYRSLLRDAAESASAFPLEIGATTYYTGPELAAPMRAGAGFIDELYRRIYRPWMDVAQATPPLHVDVKLPPMLAIVLSRAMFREQIPDTLRELRDELRTVREELNYLNVFLDRTLSQADILAQVRKVNESFDAIVPEALLTDAARRWRRIASVYRGILPVKQLYSIAVDPLSVDHERFRELFGAAQDTVAKDRRIVSRYVSADSFSELLRVGSIRDMVTSHFTDVELRLLRAG